MSVELRFIPCAAFELAIHAYVDGEVTDVEARDLIVHLELCEPCRHAVELLRKQVRIHQESVELGRVADALDQNAFLRRLHGRLIDENLERMAQLFYELGKAYFLAGNDSKMRLYVHKKAISIERARAEGRRLVKETSELATRTSPTRQAASSLQRAGDLLRGKRKLRDPRPSRTALDNARRFLEECLILSHDHTAARIVLGQYFVRVDRPDEAIVEFRKVLAVQSAPAAHRAIALQNLANAYSLRRDYDKVVECYEEIVREGRVARDRDFFHVPLGLAISLAKAGRFERSVEAFGQFVANYPERTADARALLTKAEVFRRLLAERQAFHSQLKDRYPMLFAS